MMQRVYALAGRGERVLANLLDTVILAPACWSLTRLMAYTDGAELLPIFALTMLYYVAFVSSPWQATPGKRLLNIYIIRTNNRPITLWVASERFLAFILPTLPGYSVMLDPQVAALLSLFLWLGWFIPIFFTQERTGVHDMVCHTRVVSGKTGQLWAQ